MNILDLLFPKRCVGCGKVGKYFCVRCQLKIQTIDQNETICPVCEKGAIDGITHPHCKTRYSLDGLTSFFHYKGPVQKAVKSIKYRYASDLASEFIDLIPFSMMDSRLRGNDTIIVPVPLHPSRLRYRGFNQAEVLGTLIAQRFSIPMQSDILKRVRETKSQVEVMGREKRLKNMEGAFVMNNSKFDIRTSSIFLFDDVFTTGATLRSAAKVLKRAGALFVWGITMAR